MKKIFVTLLLLNSLHAICAGEVPFGDPFIMLHDNVYYAYGTQAPDGIAVYISTDLRSWMRADRLALHKDDVWGDRQFWAPEVYAVNGKFYMYFSAEEHICAAVSDSPLGPFRQQVKAPIIAGEKCIDNSLFRDDNGKNYLFFDRFNDGLNIWVAEMNDDLLTIKPETMHKCINVSQDWEKVWPRVNEGCFVMKHNGTYYMTYSANSYESPFYGIGMATATDVMGTWTKHDGNPIYQKPGELVGIGHSAMFTDRRGQLRIVFHAHHSSTQIHPRGMHLSTVAFEEKNGKEVMTIGPGYTTPELTGHTNGKTYHNPVVTFNAPDPTIVQANDGSFYLYTTETNGRLPIYHSRNLTDWCYVGAAFTPEGRPSFEPKAGIWAPDINIVEGKYVLYYAMSVWGGEQTCGIGRAVADRPEGPFTDLGMLFRSNEIGVQNSIDACYVEDEGKKYLFWGSFHGIYGIELSDDGLNLRSGAVKRQVAGTAYEGAYIHRRGGYYYLFASVGSCCEGLKSTYTTVVGRSQNLWGPYVDRQGRSMLDNHHETLIHKSERFVGVGHNSEIVHDNAGNDWLFYHGYDTEHPQGRRLFLDHISWPDGWPEVKDGIPSTEGRSPYFGELVGMKSKAVTQHLFISYLLKE